MIDDIEETTLDDFTAAAIGNEFSGQQLQPWTPPRKIAAQSMGMLYPLIGDAGMEQLQTTGIYPGALKDTIIYLWLCSKPTPADIQRAIRKPQEAWNAAQQWAETADLVDLTSEAFVSGYQLFTEKMAAEQAARSKPAINGASKESTTNPND